MKKLTTCTQQFTMADLAVSEIMVIIYFNFFSKIYRKFNYVCIKQNRKKIFLVLALSGFILKKFSNYNKKKLARSIIPCQDLTCVIFKNMSFSKLRQGKY